MKLDWEDILFITLAAARRSPDPSTQNGAILVSEHYEDDYGLTLMGQPLYPYFNTLECNRFPNGVEATPTRWERSLKYMMVSHAEANALSAAARYGIPTNGLTLVCPWLACDRCAVQIINSGISHCVTLPRVADTTNTRWDDSISVADKMLEEAGIKLTFVDTTLGVQIRRNGELVVV